MSELPTVKFNLREEVMKDALKIKQQMGMTWREVTLQGLGMAVIPPPKIGRPKSERRSLSEKEEILKKQIMLVFDKTFYNAAIWRQFLPLVNLSDEGWQFYRYYVPIGEKGDDTYDSREIILPIIDDEFPIYKNGRLNIRGIQESANRIAIAEGKLVLTGDHEGWSALGERGMLTTEGRQTTKSTGAWPDGAIKDLVQINRDLKPETPIVLIVSSGAFALINQVLWEDPLHSSPPTTYKKFILDQEIVSGIYEVDELYSQQGMQNSAIIFTPSKENAYLVQALKPSPLIWEGKDGELMCIMRESINIAIARPEKIIELTDITTK